MAAPATVATCPVTQGIILRETQWQVPIMAPGAKGAAATKGMAAGKGTAVCKAVMGTKGAGAWMGAGEGMTMANGTPLAGGEWELPETAKAVGAKGAGAKGAAVNGMAAKGGAGVTVQATGAAVAPPAAGNGAVAAVKSAATGGTIWKGTGLSLGWGLGLGAWGPVILLGTAAAVGAGIYNYLKNRQEGELTAVTQ